MLGQPDIVEEAEVCRKIFRGGGRTPFYFHYVLLRVPPIPYVQKHRGRDRELLPSPTLSLLLTAAEEKVIGCRGMVSFMPSFSDIGLSNKDVLFCDQDRAKAFPLRCVWVGIPLALVFSHEGTFGSPSSTE